jgi:hypothetical protein
VHTGACANSIGAGYAAANNVSDHHSDHARDHVRAGPGPARRRVRSLACPHPVRHSLTHTRLALSMHLRICMHVCVRVCVCVVWLRRVRRRPKRSVAHAETPASRPFSTFGFSTPDPVASGVPQSTLIRMYGDREDDAEFTAARQERRRVIWDMRVQKVCVRAARPHTGTTRACVMAYVAHIHRGADTHRHSIQTRAMAHVAHNHRGAHTHTHTHSIHKHAHMCTACATHATRQKKTAQATALALAAMEEAERAAQSAAGVSATTAGSSTDAVAGAASSADVRGPPKARRSLGDLLLGRKPVDGGRPPPAAAAAAAIVVPAPPPYVPPPVPAPAPAPTPVTAPASALASDAAAGTEGGQSRYAQQLLSLFRPGPSPSPSIVWTERDRPPQPHGQVAVVPTPAAPFEAMPSVPPASSGRTHPTEPDPAPAP